MTWIDLPPIVWVLTAIVGGGGIAHAILYQSDERKAAYWIVLILVLPIAGAALYLLLGINLIRRQAREARGDYELRFQEPSPEGAGYAPSESQTWDLGSALDRISRFTLSPGNSAEVFSNGDEAMPAMLEGIRSATRSISMASYIFESKGIGAEFVEALKEAVERGVEVRVMVDGAGMGYSWPPVTRVLRKAGVPCRQFMPSQLVMKLITLNLRNHRKLLVIDGAIAFTGGMNIREGNMLARNPKHPVRDLHFRFDGPVAAQVQRVFAEDWHFCCGEVLEGETWFPPLATRGSIAAIGIVDGPDEDMEVMPVALFAALSSARHTVKLLTPYFLPTDILLAALRLCALRNVEVTILTPSCNNIPVVHWASQTFYRDLLLAGCEIYESPAPFDHSKLMVIDDEWAIVGSTNWDPRSLRLNFEFNLATRDVTFAHRLTTIFNSKLHEAQRITLPDVEKFSIAQRFRNGIARLFKPLL